MPEGNVLPPAARILLTGATGQVGYELRDTLSGLGELVTPERGDLDMANASSVRSAIRRFRPRWIVNAAAYTAVDKAESEPEAAFAVNAEAVRVIGEEAAASGACVLHFSTDYVFDGGSARPYTEADVPAPVSVYGASKLAGERALAESGAAHLIFRTSWVYGSHGRNFLLTILKLAQERERLRIVADQHGAPTWSRDLARLAAHVITRCEGSGQGATAAERVGDRAGVYHAAGRGETTWFGFAEEAVRRMRERLPETNFAELEAITTAAYPTPARRPANSRLNGHRLEQQFGWHMMDWRESLRQVIAEL